MSASKFSIQNWERKRAPQRAVKEQGKREVATVSTGFSFLVQLGEAKYHLAEKITFLPKTFSVNLNTKLNVLGSERKQGEEENRS